MSATVKMWRLGRSGASDAPAPAGDRPAIGSLAARVCRNAGLGALALLGLVLSAVPARCEPPRLFNFYDFQFENGSVLPELRIAYETRGTLSPARDNAIVLIHDARGNRHDFDGLIGPGKPFDTDKYFVVTADMIGGGDSAAPADGPGQDFPRYTIRDMMEAQNALVTRGLELTRVRAVGGNSMGAFIALEWGIHYPELMQGIVLLAPSVKTEASLDLIIDVMTSVIALDPEWHGGRYTRNPVEGLRHAGMLYYPWDVSAPYLDRVSGQRLAKEVEATAQSFAIWDANSLVMRYAACRGHDVSVPYAGDMSAALARVAASVLIMPVDSDRLLGLMGARRIRDGVKRATYVEIPSDLGHRAIYALPETAERELIDQTLRGFLATLNIKTGG